MAPLVPGPGTVKVLTNIVKSLFVVILPLHSILCTPHIVLLITQYHKSSLIVSPPSLDLTPLHPLSTPPLSITSLRQPQAPCPSKPRARLTTLRSQLRWMAPQYTGWVCHPPPAIRHPPLTTHHPPPITDSRPIYHLSTSGSLIRSPAHPPTHC